MYSLSKSLFEEYIFNNYYDQISNKVISFCCAHKEYLLEQLSSDITCINGIELEDIDTVFIRISENTGTSIDFDIVICPEITCYCYLSKYRDNDSFGINKLWLTISCKGDIAKSLRDFKVTYVDFYDKTEPSKPLDCDMVPVYNKDTYDIVANEILSKYYSFNNSLPERIDIEKLAQKMGLNIIYRKISRAGNIFGQFFFETSKAIFIDNDGNEKEEVVTENTIVIDIKASSYYSLCSHDLSIAHEIIHAYCHKKAFLFSKMINGNLSSIQCEITGTIKNGARDATIWMERQANAVAPCLLMPKNEFLNKYNELESEYVLHCSSDPLIYFDTLIRDLADFFQVTVYSARKRLIDLGVNMAIGFLNWNGTGYVKPYIVKKGELTPNQTYTIKSHDLANNILTNSSLLSGVMEEKFVFVENHLCINSNKYIEFGVRNILQLTDYARRNMDECCIKFNCINSQTNSGDNGIWTACYLCRDIKSLLPCKIEFSKECNFKAMAAEFKSRSKEVRDLLGLIGGKTFGESLKEIKKYYKLIDLSIAIDSGMDEKNISRYMNDQIKQPTKKAVIAICHAMNVPMAVSSELFKKASVALNPGSEEDDLYLVILSTMQNNTIEEINLFLQDAGFEKI